MANRIVKIKNICHVIKGETGITKAIPGDYPMVTLAEERKTHNEYQFDCKAVIIPLVSSTGHGHASMKRIHFQEGKFALGSILCALVPKKENEYVPEYLYHILDMSKERIFVPLMKGMANVSLPMNRIKDVEINLPPYEEQLRLAEIYQKVSKNIDLLKNETIKQKDYIPKLRQSILQMAVQGKLTAKWRDENPVVESASVLLERIKTIKEQSIVEGKTKRQRSIPINDPDANLKVLPVTWEKAFLIEISDLIMGQSPSGDSYNDIGEGIPLINGPVEFGGMKPFDKTIKTKFTTKPTKLCKEGDLLICVRGSTTGRTNISAFDACIGRGVAAIRPYVYDAFIYYYILFAKEEIFGLGKGSTFPNVTQNQLQFLSIPIPPIEEQKEIVSKVKQLMTWCDELEKKIEKRDKYQEKLMQAVVKQAFKTEKEMVVVQ